MPIPETVTAFAIVPSNDLSTAILFWKRLGFVRTGGDDRYIIVTGWGCEVHLTPGPDGMLVRIGWPSRLMSGPREHAGGNHE